MFDRMKGCDRCPTKKEVEEAVRRFGKDHQSLDRPYVEFTIRVVLDGSQCCMDHSLLTAKTRPKPVVL